MTGLEALKNMCENCERSKVGRKQLCPFRSISNDYCEEYETIEKELKAFEIIKKKKVLLPKLQYHCEVDNYRMYCDYWTEFHFKPDINCMLNEAEFNLIKGVSL